MAELNHRVDDSSAIGRRVRTQVLGAEHVEASHRNKNQFNSKLVDLTEEYCWGEVWGGANLDLKTLSMMTIVMLGVLNRPDELRAHLRGARTNGCSDDDIVQAILQVAVYCGIPAAIDMSRAAYEALGVNAPGQK